MHLEILKKGFLPPVSLHPKGVDRIIRPTFPKEAATLPEVRSAERFWREEWFREAKYFDGEGVPSLLPSESIAFNILRCSTRPRMSF